MDLLQEILSGMPLAFALLVAWLLVVGGARRLQVELNHYAVHNRVFAGKKANRWLVEIVSTLLCIQDYEGYHTDHVLGHHNPHIFCGPNDPDWVFLKSLGLRPGMSRRQCWRWLLKTCFSPRFHALFLSSRLKANFLSKHIYRRVMSVCWWTMAIALTLWFDVVGPVLLLWILPITFLYHISALLQFTSEHKWASPFVPGESSRQRQARLSHSRYCLTPLPERELHRSGWTYAGSLVSWAFIVLLVDIPARVACIVGELPVHDRHHRLAGEKEWALVIYLPGQADSSDLASPAYWGLIAALNGVFDHLAAMPEETT